MSRLDNLTTPKFAVHGEQGGIFKTVQVAPDERTLRLMQQATTMVEGVTLEPIAAETSEEKNAAARLFGQVAVDLNSRSSESPFSPEGWTETARKALEHGGAVVRLTISQKINDSRGLGPFWAKVNELKAEQSPAAN